MRRACVSFAAPAPPLRPSNAPGFSSEKVLMPFRSPGIVSLQLAGGQSETLPRPGWSSALLTRVRRQTAMAKPGVTLANELRFMNFSAANLIGGFIFGSIGFVAFIYGKRLNLWKPMFIGLALMVYPYFVSSDLI